MDIPSLFMIPSAVSSGKVHSVFPNSTDADFDFNRDSDATRVNSEGLIERVGYYGSEEITNGSFDTDSNWVKGTGWSIANGKASNDGSQSGTSEIYQTGVVVIGKTYKLVYNIVDYTSGTLRIRCGNTFDVTNNAIGTYTAFLTATSNAGVGIQASADFIGSIDNVSVKEVTGDRARLNYEIEGGLVNTKPSLLLEPQSTNLVTYSEDFSQWDNNGSTDTSNATTSPSGQITADKITKLGNSGNDRVTLTSITVSNSTSYAISAFVKNDTNVTGGVTTLAFRVSGGTLFRRGYEWGANGLSFATTQASGTRTNEILEDYGNGWYRVGFSFTTNGTSGNFEVDIDRVNGTNTTSIFVWGAMLEQQSYATSYIPTNGSTQTRAAETCNGAGTSSILPSEEGILYAEIARPVNDSVIRSIALSDGSAGNVVLIQYYNNNIGIVVKVSSSAQAVFSISNTTLDFNKIAISWKSNSYKAFVNGTQTNTDTSGSTFSAGTLSEFAFDRGDGGEDFYGKIRDIRVYNTKEMTDSEVDILLTKITS